MSEEMKTKLLSNQTKSLDWCVSILPTWKMNYKKWLSANFELSSH